jgi:ATP-binding cassette subfamily C (CFTR/MRP) protein 1
MDNVLTMTTDGQVSSFGRFKDASGHETVESEIQANMVPATSTPSPAKEVTSILRVVSSPDQSSTDAVRQNGDWRLYHHYILSIGWWRFAILLSVHAIDAALVNFPSQSPTYIPSCISSLIY